MATFKLTGKKIILLIVVTVALASLVFFVGLLAGAHRNPSAEASPVARVGADPVEGGPESGAGTSALGEVAAVTGSLPSAQQLPGQNSFALLVGSFLLKEDAELDQQLWTDLGYEPHVERIRDREQKQIFNVRIGSYRTYEQADKAAEDFDKKEGRGVIVVRVRSPEPGL